MNDTFYGKVKHKDLESADRIFDCGRCRGPQFSSDRVKMFILKVINWETEEYL